MSYDRLNWSYPIPEKDISKKAMYERLQSIYQLPLPMDVISNLVLLFKYDILKKQYKKNYRKVLVQLKKRFKRSQRSQRLVKRIDGTFPYAHFALYEKKVEIHGLYPSPQPCP